MGTGKGRVCPLSPVRLSPFQQGRPPTSLGSAESSEAGVPSPRVPASGRGTPGKAFWDVWSRRKPRPIPAHRSSGESRDGGTGQALAVSHPLPLGCLSQPSPAKRWFAWRGRGERGRRDSQTCR